MWIKTANGNLCNAALYHSIYRRTFRDEMTICGAYGDDDTTDKSEYEVIFTGAADEADAILDRIARGIAAGLPLLDLGQPDSEHGLPFAGKVIRITREPIFSEDTAEYLYTNITAIVREQLANLKPTVK